ncbi:hypothetical protein J2T05_003439 [Cupriavidus necator]|nr:hypothetical protein [Cupriavidus necator]
MKSHTNWTKLRAGLSQQIGFQEQVAKEVRGLASSAEMTNYKGISQRLRGAAKHESDGVD